MVVGKKMKGESVEELVFSIGFSLYGFFRVKGNGEWGEEKTEEGLTWGFLLFPEFVLLHGFIGIARGVFGGKRERKVLLE